MWSKRFELSKKDINNIFHYIGIIIAPVALIFIDQLIAGNIDISVIFTWLLSSIWVIIKIYITDNSI